MSKTLSRRTLGVALLAITPASCVHLPPVISATQKGIEAELVAEVTPNTPFAWHPGGEALVFVRGGVRRFDLKRKRERLIARPKGEIAALEFSPSGEALAVGIRRAKGGELLLLGERGETLGRRHFTGHLAALKWRSDDELLVVTIALERYSFGGNLKGELHRWDKKGAPRVETLWETTIKRSHAAKAMDWGVRTLRMEISPLGHELLYSRFVDPPAFPPRLSIVTRDLQSRVERQIATVGLRSGGAVYSADGERVFVGDGQAISQWIDPWLHRRERPLALRGEQIAISCDGRLLLIDGQLYQDGELIARLLAPSAARFAPRAGALLLRHSGALWRIRGLVASSPVRSLSSAEHVRLRKLRSWRARGLITTEEYRATRKRIVGR